MDINWNVHEQVPQGYEIWSQKKSVMGSEHYKAAIDKMITKNFWLEVEREPNNKFDSNAIKINACWKTMFGKSRNQIGYIDAKTAKRIIDKNHFDKISLGKRHVWISDDGIYFVEYALYLLDEN